MEIPTIAFKSVILKPNNRNSKNKVSVPEEHSLGHETLSLLLKSYQKSLETIKPLNACVIGFNGVGKTSVVESMKQSRLNPIYAVNHVEEDFAKINRSITVFDTPSYELDLSNVHPTKAILQNLITPDEIENVMEPIAEIIKRITPLKLSELYSISEFTDEFDFINQVGQRKGRLAPGGVTNMNEAADIVINDWNAGKMKYYTDPPKNIQIQNPIDNKWVEKINIKVIYDKEKEILYNLSDDNYNFSTFTGELNNIQVIITNQENNQDMDDNDTIMKDQEEDEEKPMKKEVKKPTKKVAQKPKSIKKNVNKNEDFNFATDFWDEEDQNM